MEMPPTLYKAVFQANLPSPESPIEVFSGQDMRVTLDPGPLSFTYSVPNVRLRPPGVVATPKNRRIVLPQGSYVVIDLELPERLGAHPGRYAALRVSEAAALVELRYRPLLSEKIYQGPVDRPGETVFLPENPLRLVARPALEPETVASTLGPDFEAIAKLNEQPRQRFQLASRWFMRGVEAPNSVDKLLSWWTVLEIYPSEGEMDVSNSAAGLIRKQLYPKLDTSDVKAKLRLGQIEGKRGDIVHQGIAYVPEDEEKTFDEYLERLEAVVIACLRLLAGL